MQVAKLTDKIVPFSAIQIAARQEGLDEINFDLLDIIESDNPTQKQINQLISQLVKMGFTEISFDLEEANNGLFSIEYGDVK